MHHPATYDDLLGNGLQQNVFAKSFVHETTRQKTEKLRIQEVSRDQLQTLLAFSHTIAVLIVIALSLRCDVLVQPTIHQKILGEVIV